MVDKSILSSGSFSFSSLHQIGSTMYLKLESTGLSSGPDSKILESFQSSTFLKFSQNLFRFAVITGPSPPVSPAV